MIAFVGYIVTILLTNLGFHYITPIDIGFGFFSPMAIMAGAVFVVRDFAQRAVGHYVLAGMAIGCLLSYLLADPYIALASVASFSVSEITDWLLYTFSEKPFHKRVLWSSVAATPIDTFVFLYIVELNSPATFGLMVGCKLITAIGVYVYGIRKEQDHRRGTSADPLPCVRKF